MKADDPMPTGDGLHITVATTATLRGLSLAEELRLVKAVLLYADSRDSGEFYGWRARDRF
jgi:hypothetical protein